MYYSMSYSRDIIYGVYEFIFFGCNNFENKFDCLFMCFDCSENLFVRSIVSEAYERSWKSDFFYISSSDSLLGFGVENLVFQWGASSV